MTKIKLFTLSLFALLPFSTAFAADSLNMIGTWVGVANVAVLGVNPHHNTTNTQEVRFFRSDMKSGVMTDSDGHRSFQMVGHNLMDSCYTHTIISNGKSTVAECNELKRQ
jgi:hypothetical protein